ncbi:MAG: hypothetical protein C0417_04215 [Chlorobiaceae bacterium]|nr:hypothetical protein [Chlorobiaceae bacterium]
MLNDFKKSILLVLQERISSPFSGAFFFSWFIWNWRMLYFIFFAPETLSLNERFAYIDAHFLNWQENLVLPILSAVFFIGLYPIITTAALWVWLKYKKFQTDLKNRIEGQQLLTLDQSVALRLELENQHERLDRLTKAKDDEILLLRRETQELKQLLSQGSISLRSTTPQHISLVNDYKDDITEFLNNAKVLERFPEAIDTIKGNFKFSDDYPSDVMAYLIGNEIITRKQDRSTYEFTEKGKAFLKAYTKNVQGR